jgi:hypothetical protein
VKRKVSFEPDSRESQRGGYLAAVLTIQRIENLISYTPTWEYANPLSLNLDAESDLEPPHIKKVGETLHVVTSGDSTSKNFAACYTSSNLGSRAT